MVRRRAYGKDLGLLRRRNSDAVLMDVVSSFRRSFAVHAVLFAHMRLASRKGYRFSCYQMMLFTGGADSEDMHDPSSHFTDVLLNSSYGSQRVSAVCMFATA